MGPNTGVITVVWRFLSVEQIQAPLIAQGQPASDLEVKLGRVGAERSSHQLAFVGPVKRMRQRFLARRLEGLLDEPRPGAPREVSYGTSSGWCA